MLKPKAITILYKTYVVMLKNVGYLMLLDVSQRIRNNRMRGHSHELSIYHSNAFKLRPVVMNYPKVHWIFFMTANRCQHGKRFATEVEKLY